MGLVVLETEKQLWDLFKMLNPFSVTIPLNRLGIGNQKMFYIDCFSYEMIQKKVHIIIS